MASPSSRLVRRDVQRRQQADHVAVEAAREEDRGRARRPRRRPPSRDRARARRTRTRASGRGRAPRRSRGGATAMSSRRARSVSPSSRAPARNSGSVDDVEDGERRGARERVPAERAAEPAGRHGIHDLGATGHAGERQAAADATSRRRVMSGSTPSYCSIAHIVPVRPTPDCTSSSTYRIPCERQSSCSRAG